MTPIESVDDIRLVTFAGVLIAILGELALKHGTNPDTLLAEELYTVSKRIHERGQSGYMNDLIFSFPILAEALNLKDDESEPVTIVLGVK